MDSFFHSITTLRHSSSKIIHYVLRVLTMASAQLINCIVCDEPVRPRQQGVQCDGCLRWNHRLCNTGKYREDRGTHAFIRKVMALPFLEEEDIRPQFQRTSSPVHRLCIEHLDRKQHLAAILLVSLYAVGQDQQ